MRLAPLSSPMNPERVEAEVLSRLRQHIKADVALGPEIDLIAETQMDSVALMEVIADLEDTFGILLDDEALQSVVSAGDLIHAITTCPTRKAH